MTEKGMFAIGFISAILGIAYVMGSVGDFLYDRMNKGEEDDWK